jgi:hypothetical protein
MMKKTKFERGKTQKKDYKEPLKTGEEKFSLFGKETELNVNKFWSFMYSNLYDIQDSIAEYLVAMALEKKTPDNRNGWTFYDIKYRDYRIEVKSTAYFQLWKASGEISEVRNFGIQKTHVKYQDTHTPLERQNDIYVFCVNNGRTYETANPLVLEHWKFYIVPTSVINLDCNDNKTISLNKVKKLADMEEGIYFDQIKDEIDRIIDNKL